tara:strand:+ start:812 stop:1369 length:558 start_codon:yes stop_codon:yes gene_type:complete
MHSKVIVSADDKGNVIRQTKNEEWSNIILRQNKSTFGNNNVVNNKSLSVLILGRTEDLKAMNLQAGQELDGHIYVKEQVMPFNENDPDRDLKIAGDTGIVCVTADGEPIYRKAFYDPSGTLKDVPVAHANGAEIRAALGLETKVEPKAKSKQIELEDSIAEIEADAKAKADSEDLVQDETVFEDI